MLYPIKLTNNGSKWEARASDLNGCIVEADTKERALELVLDMAMDCMELLYRRKKIAIPLPSELTAGDAFVYVPVKAQVKILLWNALIENGMNLTDLSNMLEISPSQAQRLVDISKKASTEAVENALLRLGSFIRTNSVKQKQAVLSV